MQHIVFPTFRWAVRHKANAVIGEANQKLALKIPTFKLTKREVLIDRISYAPEVLQTIELMATDEQVTREKLMGDVQRYAKEIVPAFNALIYFKFGYWVARKLLNSMYRVRLGFSDDEALTDIEPDTSVVFIMNHRSNVDYIIATYLAAERTALSYAVGEWARVWPLQQLIRMMGGYFVRRNSDNPLYRKVLQTYVQLAADGGIPQAVFPEGRLSRDGIIGEPKLGLRGYITKGFDATKNNDIVFIPVGINYDRVMEDRTLTLKPNEKKANKITSTVNFLRFMIKNVLLGILGQRYRNGYACVNFGKPVSLKQWRKQTRDQELADISDLANYLLGEIGAIVPILPVSVACTALLREPSTGSLQTLRTIFLRLIKELEDNGYRPYIPRNDKQYAFTVALRMLTLRRLVTENDGEIIINQSDSHLIQYYANSIQHLFVNGRENRATGNDKK